MDWISIVASLFGSSSGSGGKMSGGGWFSTSTASDSVGGTIVQNFGDSRPVYNQSALSALEDINPVNAAIAAFAVVAVVIAWRKLGRK